jgi:phospholipid transport system transporter-binding protein
VIRRDGDALFLDGALTLATVSGLAEAVRDHLRQGATVVDFRGVTEVDSAAVALALEWLRQAAQRDGRAALRFSNLPVAMQNLAKLYGVSDLLQPASS